MLKKITNTTTTLALTSTIILILSTLGLEIDNEKIMIIVKAICSLLVLLGIMDDKGMETTEWNK